jgi:hypothetical protein
MKTPKNAILRTISAAIAALMIISIASSCGKTTEEVETDTTTKVTTTAAATTEAVTTTEATTAAPQIMTVDIATTAEAEWAEVTAEPEAAAEPAQATEPEAATEPAPAAEPAATTTTAAATTTAPVTTTAQRTTTAPATTTAQRTTTVPAATTVPWWETTFQITTTAAAAINYPPEKTYKHIAPNYSGLTPVDTVINSYSGADKGRVLAYSHQKVSDPAGFIIDYNPNEEYLSVSYGTEKDALMSDGKRRAIIIDLSSANYGKTFIGEIDDGKKNGEGYVYWGMNDPRCAWYTYKDDVPDGTAYYYDGNAMYIQNYENGKLVSESRETDWSYETGWYLNASGTFSYSYEQYFQGFVLNGKANYFGYYDWGKGKDKYRGQWLNSEKVGLGIYTWPNGDVFIGDFTNKNGEGFGLYYFGATDTANFSKQDGGQWVTHDSINGVKSEIKKLFK